MNASAAAVDPAAATPDPGLALELLDACADAVFLVDVADSPPRLQWAGARLAQRLGESGGPRPGAPIDFLRAVDDGADFATVVASRPAEFRVRVELGGEPLRGLADLAVRQVPGRPELRLCTLAFVPDDWIVTAASDLPLPLLVLDSEMRVRWINPEGARRVGLPRAELIGRAWPELAPEAEGRRERLAEVLAGRLDRATFPAVPITFPGQPTRWFRAHYRALRDAHGRVDAVAVIAEETTGEQRAEQALAQSEQRLRAITGHLLDLVNIVAPDGTIRFQCGSGGVSGYDPATRVGRSCVEFVHPDDATRYRDWLARVAASPPGTAFGEERVRVRRVDGEWREVSVRASNQLHVPGVDGIVQQIRDESEHEVARRTLRRAQEALALAVEAARIGFFECTLDPDRFEASDEYWLLRGLEPPAARAGARPPWDDMHPEDRERVRAELARVASADGVWQLECRLSTGDGGWLWVLQHGRIVERAPDGSPRRLTGIVLDVDRRKRAELALAESEARYRTIAATTPGFLYESEILPDGRFVVHWASEGLERFLGWSAAEINARGGWDAVIHPDDRAGSRERRMQVMAGGTVRAETRLVRRDGAVVWMASYAYPLLADTGGRVLGLIGAMYDVTHLKVTEQALRQSEERFRVAAAAVQGVIYEVDLATGRTSTSRPIGELLGLAAEVPGEDWRAHVHPEDRPQLSHDRLPAPGGITERNYRVRHAEGRWLHVWDRSTVVVDAGGRPERLIGWAVDVTPRVRTERLLAEAEAVAHVGSWGLDVRSGHLTWSDETYRIHGLARETYEPRLESALACYAPEHRAVIAAAVERALADGAPWDLEAEIVTAQGERRWIRTSGRAETLDGRVTRLYGAFQDVDARRRMQEQLRAQGDWLRLSIDAAEMGVWRWYPRTDTVLVEYQSRRLVGAVPDRLSLADWLERVPVGERARVRAAFEATARDGVALDVEYGVLLGDGSVRWALTRAHRSFAAGEAVITGATQDITARRSAEAALAASEATLRSVAENAPDFVTIFDRDLRIRFVNRRLRGLRPEQVVGRSAEEFATGPVEELRSHLLAVFGHGGTARYESVFAGPDGALRHFEHRVGPIRTDGRIDGVIAYSTDITERRAAERRLRTQASVMATMHEGVVVVDAAGIVRLTNPAFDRMYGYEPGALEGEDIARLTAEGGDFPSADRRTTEFVARRRDGMRFEAAAVTSRLEVGGERYAVHVVQDVTERRALERELLEIANREQRRIGSDLHDGLGQELTGVALMLSGLGSRVRRGQPVTPREVDELVALVNGAIEGTRALARGLSPVELERGGLVYALRALAARAHDLYGLDVRFRSRVLPRLTLDAAANGHLYRIAQEALTNAARHARAARVVVQLTARGRAVSLSVTDDGLGMPESEPLGMGLKIMRYRAGMMGGELAVEAVEPHGTRVVCRVRQPDPELALPREAAG